MLSFFFFVYSVNKMCQDVAVACSLPCVLMPTIITELDSLPLFFQRYHINRVRYFFFFIFFILEAGFRLGSGGWGGGGGENSHGALRTSCVYYYIHDERAPFSDRFTTANKHKQ